MWAMNCQHYETNRDSPYHLVFCKQPSAGVFPGAQQNCMVEKDISSNVQINEVYDDLGSDVQHSDNELVPTQPQAATEKTTWPQAQEDDNAIVIGASMPRQQPVPTPMESVQNVVEDCTGQQSTDVPPMVNRHWILRSRPPTE